MKLSISLLLVILTACASIEDVSKREPTFQAHSDKAVQEYVVCIQKKWINLGGADVTVGKDNTLVRGSTGALAEVSPGQKGSEIVLREPPLVGTSLEEAAKSCL